MNLVDWLKLGGQMTVTIHAKKLFIFAAIEVAIVALILFMLYRYVDNRARQDEAVVVAELTKVMTQAKQDKFTFDRQAELFEDILSDNTIEISKLTGMLKERKVKVERVVEYKTETVPVEIPCVDDSQGVVDDTNKTIINASASVKEISVETLRGKLFMDANVWVELSNDKGWNKTLQLPVHKDDIQFTVNTDKIVARDWHTGKGCVVGPSIFGGVSVMPDIDVAMGVGVGVTCGWGVVK